MTTITTASHQWASRPSDERFANLIDMANAMTSLKHNSRPVVCSSRKLEAVPSPDHKGLAIQGPNGHAYAPTHHAFSQLANLAGAPASYLRDLPSELAADCLNFGFKVSRDVKDIGVLLTRPMGSQQSTISADDMRAANRMAANLNSTSAPYTQAEIDAAETNSATPLDPVIRAATGPNYGRIWNSEICDSLVDRFGDGVSGHWRVPGEFGQKVEITKANTTLYAGDRDMFVFLCDEDRRIEIPNRRNGANGSMARGFFVWNSEVGAATFGIATFLFDYVCCNRIIWGADQYKEIRVRHTSGAPDRFIEQMVPALRRYSEGSSENIVAGIAAAKAAKVADVSEFLAKRKFTVAQIKDFQETHKREEHRPIETIFDCVTAITAEARSIKHQDQRVALERQAGSLMELVATR